MAKITFYPINYDPNSPYIEGLKTVHAEGEILKAEQPLGHGAMQKTRESVVAACMQCPLTNTLPLIHYCPDSDYGPPFWNIAVDCQCGLQPTCALRQGILVSSLKNGK